MEEKNEYRIKDLLSEIDREFYSLPSHEMAKVAIEQISSWQQKFNEAKNNLVKENFRNFVDATCEFKILNQSPEIEA